MNGFDPAEIKLGDAKASIPSSRMLRVGARLEEIMTYGQFIKVFSDGTTFQGLKPYTVTEAYCLLLTEAGIEHDQRDISQRLLSGELSLDAGESINAIYSQLSPQEDVSEEELTAKKPPKPRRKKTKK